MHENKLNNLLETSNSDILKDSVVFTYEGSKDVSMKASEMIESINKIKEELEIMKTKKNDH